MAQTTIIRRRPVLNELVASDTRPPAPPATDEKGAGRPQGGGEFWMQGNTWIPVNNHAGKEDFAQVAFTRPEEFGLTAQDVLDYAMEKDAEHTGKFYQEWLQKNGNHRNEFEANHPVPFASGRIIGENILLFEGWSRIHIEPQYSMVSLSSWKPKTAHTALRESIKKFPWVMSAELIFVYVGFATFGSVTATRVHGRFSSTQRPGWAMQTAPGFAGPFSAALRWLEGNPVKAK